MTHLIGWLTARLHDWLDRRNRKAIERTMQDMPAWQREDIGWQALSVHNSSGPCRYR